MIGQIPYPCECAVAGFCARHQDKKTQRDWEFCQGINCREDQSIGYKKFWDHRAAVMSQPIANVQQSSGTQTLPEAFVAVPRNQWPAAAALIATLAAHGDVGVGDTIKRLLGSPGMVYQAAFRAITGSDCTGCGFRQMKWNQLYPYGEA